MPSARYRNSLVCVLACGSALVPSVAAADSCSATSPGCLTSYVQYNAHMAQAMASQEIDWDTTWVDTELAPAASAVQSAQTTAASTAAGIQGGVSGATSGGYASPGSPTDWWPQNSSWAGGLGSISCPSTTHCVAVAGDGTGRITHDGGATAWQPIYPPGGGGLRSVSCPTATDCWAVGYAANLGSSDGGWTYQSVIDVSHDGGASWAQQSVPIDADLSSISCPTRSDCWAVASYPSSVVLATTNGGTTWQVEYSKGNVPAGDYSGPSPMAISCPTSTTCVAVGAALLTTSDGGVTWTQRSIRDLATYIALYSVSCATSVDCWAGAYNGSILASADGGSTWSPRYTPAPATAATLGGISCPTAADCVAVGNPGTVVSTNDGGSTWSYQQLPATGLTAVTCVPVDPRNCWAAGDNTIYAKGPGKGALATAGSFAGTG